MTIALAIPHTPWIPERLTSMARLRNGLNTASSPTDRWPALDHGLVAMQTFTDKEPNWSWSAKLWQWGIDSGADHLLQLQDDVIVDANFWPNLREMIAEAPDQIIGLESVHPIAKYMHTPWYTTSDCLIGVGYVMPRQVLQEFMAWRYSLRDGAIKSINEDTLVGVFCLATGRKIWHPRVTIIDHDVEVRSTYSNDSHGFRKPALTTVRGDIGEWKTEGEPPHFGRWYGEMPMQLAIHWIDGLTALDVKRMREDTGADSYRQVISEALAIGDVHLCCLCGRNPPGVNGMTGLKACPQCIGLSANSLLRMMVCK